jgi:5-formyltetrahydrofolate cyclo-ligase
MKLRCEMITKRRSMTAHDVSVKSKEIYKKMVGLGTDLFTGPVFIYVSFDNEVDTCGLISHFLEIGIDVSVPVIAEDGTIKAVCIESMKDLVCNKFGIAEPKRGRVTEPENISCIIVPGIVFDRELNRIGYGKGCYDKYMKGMTAKKIALAYDFQIQPHIAADANDIKMDMIITDKEIIL